MEHARVTLPWITQPLRLLGSLLVVLGLAMLGWAVTACAAPTTIDQVQERLGVSRLTVQTLRLGAPERIALDLGGRQVTLRLERSQLRAPGFRVLVQNAAGLGEVPAPEAATWRGTVDEIPGSIVGATIRNGQLRAAIALGDGRLFYVEPLDAAEAGGDPRAHAVYNATQAGGRRKDHATAGGD